MSKNSAPAPAPEPAEPAAAVDTPAESVWGNWLYTGPSGRIYTNIPLHAEPGNVVTCFGAPGVDWAATTDEPNVRPDNWRAEPEPATPDIEPPAPAGDES